LYKPGWQCFYYRRSLFEEVTVGSEEYRRAFGIKPYKDTVSDILENGKEYD
jgi:hypothetical protein